MNEATWAIVILWIFLYIYSMLGSIDFGAGFWAMVFGQRKNTRATDLANRFLSPTWKITNVFLVLFVVAWVGFFPRATQLLGTLLVIPVCLTVALLILRSAFMVYAYSIHSYRGWLPIVSGVTGLLIPGLLVSILPLTLGGFVDISSGVPKLLFAKLFTSPSFYAHLGFGLTSELFLSALFLADYSRESADEEAYVNFRKLAIALGPTTLAMAMLTTFTFVPEAAWMYSNLQAEWGWFVLSIASFAIGYSALWWQDPAGRNGFIRIAVVAIAVQYAFAFIGYGRAHMPYIIYPILTLADGFTSSQMFRALLVGYGIGISILIPVFVWFWRLFLKDKTYLQQRDN
jgi:cytochrome d ubiquinol oxidase subunit II